MHRHHLPGIYHFLAALLQVPVAHGKADIGIYREAGAQVITVLSSGAVCERASVDEAYLDVTAAAQQMVATAAAAKQDDNILQQQKQQDQPGQQQADQPVEGQTEADTGMGTSSSVLVPLPESVEGWHTAGMVSKVSRIVYFFVTNNTLT